MGNEGLGFLRLLLLVADNWKKREAGLHVNANR
jgi:hypothetical protein